MGSFLWYRPGLCHFRTRIYRAFNRQIFSRQSRFTPGQSSYTAVSGRQQQLLTIYGGGDARQTLAEQLDGAMYMKVDEWKRFGAEALDHEQLRALLTQLLPATNTRLIRPMQVLEIQQRLQ